MSDERLDAISEDTILGYVAIHPDNERPFCCDNDACVVMESPETLAAFILSAVGEAAPADCITEVDYDDIASDLLEGGAFAFDSKSYQAFCTRAKEDGFEGPDFDELKVVVEGVEETPLAILELEAHDENDAEEADDNSAHEHH